MTTPTDQDIYTFFKFMLEDTRGSGNMYNSVFKPTIKYLLQIDSGLVHQKFQEFKKTDDTEIDIVQGSFSYYKAQALELDTRYSKEQEKRIISEVQREPEVKYALNMWLSIHRS